MIIEMLLDVIYNILSVLFQPINIPDMPDETYTYIDTFFGYMETGASILANYTPFAYLMTLFFIIVSVDLAILLYKFIMWIVRKIPVAGIS